MWKMKEKQKLNVENEKKKKKEPTIQGYSTFINEKMLKNKVI